METGTDKVRNSPEWNRARTRVNKYLKEQKKQIDMQNEKIVALIDIINKFNDGDKNTSKKEKKGNMMPVIGLLVLVIIFMALYIYFK